METVHGCREETFARLGPDDPGNRAVVRTQEMYAAHLTDCKARLDSGEWQHDTNIVYRLLTEPGAYERVSDDPQLIPMAIEETLRLDAPVHGLFRANDREVERNDCPLKMDTKVMLLWTGANIDPNVFEDPQAFNLDRDMARVRRHLSFRYGTHFCRARRWHDWRARSS